MRWPTLTSSQTKVSQPHHLVVITDKPYKARLKSSSGAWSPSNDENADDYLEINLGDVYFICAVATQGHPNEDAWTKSYELYLFLEYWIRYKENNTQKV